MITTDLTPEEHRLATAITAACAPHVKHESATALWTAAVKHAAVTIGNERGYRTGASGCAQAAYGEWMFDVSWVRYDGDVLTGLPMAMECEWNSNDLDGDFQKLVLARAALRVFVFTHPHQVPPRDRIAALLRHAVPFAPSSSPDRYLFGGCDASTWAFTWWVANVTGVARA